MENRDVNRLKVVLAGKKRTDKWLSEHLEVNPVIVSKWCTNTAQPDIQILIRIASLLGVEVKNFSTKSISSILSSKKKAMKRARIMSEQVTAINIE